MTGRKYRTWKRIAFPSVIFLAASVLLFGEALIVRMALSKEQALPCRMTVSVNSAADLAAVAGLPAVSACTEVYHVSAEIAYGVYTGGFEVLGVNADLIDGQLISGALYPEKTAMPYLVMNEVALKAFAKDPDPAGAGGLTASVSASGGNGQAASASDTSASGGNGQAASASDTSASGGNGQADTPSAGELTGASVLLGGTYAGVCGIVADGASSPAVYMSCSSAMRYLLSQGMPSQADTAWIRLTSAAAADSASAAVNALGCRVIDPGADTASWETSLITLHYQALTACIALAAAGSTLFLSVRMDKLKYPEENDPTVLRILLVILHGLLSGIIIILLAEAWKT